MSQDLKGNRSRAGALTYKKAALLLGCFFITCSVVCFAQTYCAPTSNCFPARITRVKFGTIDNPSPTCINSGYSDYTASTAPVVTAGTSIPIQVNVGPFDGHHVAVWIDYNRDGNFSSSEFTSLGSTVVNGVFGSLKLASNVLPGLARMRIRVKSSGYAALSAHDACQVFPSGETEDYQINLQPAQLAVFVNPVSDTSYTAVMKFQANILQTDVGINDADSAKPRIWMRKAGGSNVWKSAKGAIVAGNKNNGLWEFSIHHDSLNIDKYGCDSVQFYLVAQDANNPFNMVYAPEGGANHINVAEQISPPTQPFLYRLKPRLSDTIYIGSTDCYLKTLTDDGGLFDQINKKGLDGNLTVHINSDLLENGRHQLKNTKLNGYRLTIKPAGNVLRTITAQGTRIVTLKFDGVENVHIDGSINGSGQFLRFRNQTAGSQDTTSHIKIYNSCSNVSVKNLILEHASYGEWQRESSIWLANGINRNVLIANNLFQNIPGTLVQTFILSTYGTNTATVIKNQFDNFFNAGIAAFYPAENWKIDSNEFYRTLVTSYYSYSVSAVRISGGGHSITTNNIGGQAPGMTGGPMCFINNPGSNIVGIEIAPSTATLPAVVEKNRIDNFNISNTVAAQANAFIGIYALDSKVILRDNIIGNTSTTSPTIKAKANSMIGILANGNQPVVIKNNVIAAMQPFGSGVTNVYGINRSNSANGFIASSVATEVSGNLITNLTNPLNPSTNDGLVGIRVFGGLSNMIEQNTVHNLSVTQYTMTGIQFSEGWGADRTLIQRNRIYNLVNTSTNGTVNGLSVTNENTFLDVINNQISLNNNNIVNGVTIQGIFQSSVSNSPNRQRRFLYNSVFLGGTSNGTAGSAPFVAAGWAPHKLYNNLFYNQRNGGTKGHFAYQFTSTNVVAMFANTKVNHNFYIIHDTSSFSQWGNTPKIGWGNWQQRTGGEDTSGTAFPSVVPSSQLFMNSANGNLNINTADTSAWNVNGKARPFEGITGDFDSVLVRTTNLMKTTDIGADEFLPLTAAPGSICPGGSKTFVSNLSGSIFQWQVDAGNGYTNLQDNSNFTGTATAILQITNAPSSWYKNKFRCLVNGVPSRVYTLSFVNVWTGHLDSSWENPNNWSCGAVPDADTEVIIAAGTVIINSNVSVGSLIVGSNAVVNVNTGYTLTITH